MIRLARLEGLYVDPVYTAKALAGLFHLAETDVITKGSRVCFVHTGGLAALFAYGDDLRP
jgi:1-aminocyclopropane-1-carboxylate deaminase/D-cysteine desulfhydrase-like pyridoxal-dependent ACC family enzyme